MRRKNMRAMLLRRTGAGVKVTTVTGDVTYLFCPADSFENAVEVIQHRFHHGEKLEFFSTEWARKTQFKEYMVHYNYLYELAWETPDEDYGFDAWKAYKKFLIRTLMDWTGCSRMAAVMQVSTNIICSKFKGTVAA